MDKGISVVINAYNEERNIERAIKSVKVLAGEIIVCDMHSSDRTVSVARNLGARVVFYKNVGYVEPARNFAISKAKGEWILILDADEEIPISLATKIKEIIASSASEDFVEIPRKNIIFNKWMKASMWWPDYHVRLFRKGKVVWNDQIHSKPKVSGQRSVLPAEENMAIIHHNYQTVFQFIERMNRYSSIQAEELGKMGISFSWRDLINKPRDEFLSRFFAQKGYLDGLHGFALSLLQAFSFLAVYLKLWEAVKFQEEEIDLTDIEQENKKSTKAINYWINQVKLSKNTLKRLLQKIVCKI